ncbi:hypothetical protein E2542_SST23063 [Spatholobus suberectus]|nr:hypothetical protein E2542_SST23063 [Spatholobus suberectus]
MSHWQGIPLHNPRNRIRSSHPPLDPIDIFCPLPPRQRHHPVCRHHVIPLLPKRRCRLHRHRLLGRQVCRGGTEVLWSTGQVMDKDSYIGPASGNMDILVHFTKVTSETSAMRNMDLDQFGIFDAHDAINMMVEDMDKSEFWLQLLIVKNLMSEPVSKYVSELVNGSLDLNLNEFANHSATAMNDKGKKPIYEEVPITENVGGDSVDPTLCPDEVYISDADDDGMNYMQLDNISDSSNSESEYVGEDGKLLMKTEVNALVILMKEWM